MSTRINSLKSILATTLQGLNRLTYIVDKILLVWISGFGLRRKRSNSVIAIVDSWPNLGGRKLGAEIDWIVELKLRQIFRNRTVALVGNGTSLIDQKLGEEIDRHEVVVRFNLIQPAGRERDIGSRTDMRVIGATLLERHVPYVKLLPDAEAILTTKKNENFMNRLDCRCQYYPADTPKYSFRLLKRQFGKKISIDFPTKPPRTGFVFLSLLLRYGHAAKLNLYGFSLGNDKVNQTMDFANAGIRTYNAGDFERNHCNPSVEIDLLRQLEQLGAISIHGATR